MRGAQTFADGMNIHHPRIGYGPWRVVKVTTLTPAEAKRKAQAAVLRAKADNYERRTAPICWYSRAFDLVASELRAEADALWPRAKKGGA
jgi:hypothetical protein